MEQCKQHFLSVREVAKLNMNRWNAELDKVAADAKDDKERQAIIKKNEDLLFKAVMIGTDHEDKDVQNAEATKIRCLIAEGVGASSKRTYTDNASTEKAASERPPETQELAKGLNLRAGNALSTMSSLSWVHSFVEFFYGDCLPMQPGREAKLSFEQVFRYLLEREELEYSVAGDTKPYTARPMSRWDTPEFVMMFASTLRSLNLLRSAKLTFLEGDKAKAFRADLKAIAEAKAEDFEKVLAHDKSKGAHSLLSLLQSPQVRQLNKPVYTALKHLVMQTATVPLTEGNKMKMRQQSFSPTPTVLCCCNSTTFQQGRHRALERMGKSLAKN
jgi:hypothetical protein